SHRVWRRLCRHRRWQRLYWAGSEWRGWHRQYYVYPQCEHVDADFSAGVNDYVTVRLSDGRLGHTAVVSSRRYKEDIKPLAAASEGLHALQAGRFRLTKEYD